jgi:MinD superfamily P-loop ATPase
MVGALKLPFAVVINRADLGDARTRSFFQRNQIPILEEIPDDRKVAEAYSRGVLAAEAMDEYRLLFERLLEKVTCRKW